MDEEWRLVGEGVAGELMIGGEGLARGYHKRADMTAERFVPDPYSGEEGARMYASGDVVRRRAGGGIEYIGRQDNQVKVRGHRIEMGEIESEMRGHESVEESVVVAREGEGGEVKLEGYVVKKRGKEVSGRELRKYLKERMPEQMIPGVIVVMEEMPRTASGKVDRSRLPKGEVRDEEMERKYEGPRNGVEEVLAGIWAEVLKLEKVGVNDNFFDLGGHSLLGTQILAWVREEFDVELPLRIMFEGATVAQMALTIVAEDPIPGQMEKVAQILLKVAAMSDEDLDQALA